MCIYIYIYIYISRARAYTERRRRRKTEITSNTELWNYRYMRLVRPLRMRQHEKLFLGIPESSKGLYSGLVIFNVRALSYTLKTHTHTQNPPLSRRTPFHGLTCSMAGHRHQSSGSDSVPSLCLKDVSLGSLCLGAPRSIYPAINQTSWRRTRIFHMFLNCLRERWTLESGWCRIWMIIWARILLWSVKC